MQEQIKKLPKWAQDYIERLQRQAREAHKKLDAYLDEQTKSPFFYRDWMLNGGEGKPGPTDKTIYIQTDRVCVTHGGITCALSISDDGINIKWEDEKRALGHVTMVPTSYQQITLVKPSAVKSTIPQKESNQAKPAPVGRVRRSRRT